MIGQLPIPALPHQYVLQPCLTVSFGLPFFQLAQAEAYLKAAGLDPSLLGMDVQKKKKKHKKEKGNKQKNARDS